MSAISIPEEDIRAAYHEAVREHQIRFVMVGCALALLLIPAGITLDYFVYPHLFIEFLQIRLICSLLIAAISALYFTPLGRRFFRTVTFAWIYLIQIALCVMIYLTEGASSPYYAGLNLVILGTGVILPLTVQEIVAFSSATLVLYLITCLAHGSSDIDGAMLYNNLYFIALTGIISATASFFHERRRYNEFSFSYTLGFRNQQLTEIDRLKSQFVANISHELRTPLTLILAPIEDLLQNSSRLPDKLAGALGIARSNALRLLKLVNDLLDVIRLEEGKADLERKPLRLNTLLSGVVDAMGHLAEARDVGLSNAVSRDPCWVVGDQHALEKIFFNLLSNALKFTPAGGQVAMASRIEGERIVVEVSDTGIGIASKDLPLIFDRFRQVDSSTTRRYPGTGLGLALVKELTEAMGGEVHARSQPGAGTTLTVTLPLGRPSAEEPEASGPSRSHDALERIYLAAEQTSTLPLEVPDVDDGGLEPAGRRACVLVVDDEPDMRRYLVEMLAPEYRVLQAANGRAGLSMAQSQHPDLMLLDLMLPEIDGLEVCRTLKQAPETRSIKLILLTARVDESAKLTALDHGADDFLTKPFSSVEVRTRLRNLLQTALLESDLHNRNETLEHTLTELRSTEAQLVQSEKLNALGSLAAGLLHEINNPLNYAMTALQVARIGPEVEQSADLQEILADIDEGMQRIRNIVSDLRAFAYPSQGEHQPFKFSEALRSALQFTAHELRGLRVEQALTESDEVIGSRNHIVQVLVNLLGNAALAIRKSDAQPAGGIRITSAADGERLRIVVRDSGMGIEPERLTRIFDPFYTTRDVGEGMGLGLSICHTIVRNHDGVLSARSQLGEWTEFTFDLPLAREA